jgi:hypothetical protein
MKALKDFFGSLLLPLFVLFSCSEDDQVARLRITLVDSPASYDEVNVDIQGVSVHVSETEGEDDGGWIEFEDSNVGVENLLNYTGGRELTLVDTDFPTGTISQIRLLLGEDNSVVINGVKEPMKTPSGQQSGLKLQVHETLQGGVTYNFKLDFEAARSVVHTGNDEYLLKPVIKVITKTISGAIKGSVEPAEINVAVSVMDGTEVISTTYAKEETAEFLAPGIPEGQFTVTFDPGDDSEYELKSVENVNVSIGEVTDMGVIELDLKQE